MSRRIAIFLVGGIGRGIARQGVPALTAITSALARDYRVSVYSLSSPDPAFRPDGYTVHGPPVWLAGLAGKLRWASLASQFLAEHRKEPYEVLLSFWGYPMGLFVVALAKLVGRPSVVMILGGETASVPSIGYGALRRPVTRRLVLETCERASTVVVLSTEQRETLRRHGLRREVEVIPFGVDRAMFQPPQSRPRPPPLKILNVANLTAVKDQATLLRAFAILRRDVDARLRFVGPDHLDGALQRLADELGVRGDVEFVGPVPHPDVPSHYGWAHVFVMTSLSEGQCVALAEAAASEVLLVSTRVGCVDDLGDGVVVVRTSDPADVAARICAVVPDRGEWGRKVASAYAWAESHDLRWTVERLRGVIERAAAWT